jgi:TPR repeat protein
MVSGRRHTGRAAAQFGMGYLYEHEKGVTQDYGQAVRYYRAAADQGNAMAANNLASMYQRGWGIRKSLGKAIDGIVFQPSVEIR